MTKVFTKQESLESLYYVWGNRPIQHLFKNEISEFKEDLHMCNVTESEYLEYANKQVGGNRNE